jgi:hypothetical protein
MFMPLLAPGMAADVVYEQKVGGVRRHLSDLERANVIHILGFRDFKCYAVEPFMLSWAPLNQSTPTLFPCSILRLARSFDQLRQLFLENADDRNLTKSAMLERMAQFISDKIERLHQSVQKQLERWDGGSPETYVRCSIKVLQGLHPFEGARFADFKHGDLPPAAYKAGFPEEIAEFSEIIPVDSRVVSRPRGAIPQAPDTEKYLVNSYAAAERLLDDELDLLEKEMHLLEYLDRAVKRHAEGVLKGRLFPPQKSERFAAHDLWDRLAEINQRHPEFLKAWCDWFAAIYCKNEDHGIPEPGKAIRTLLGSLPRFQELQNSGVGTKVRPPVRRFIYADLDKIYSSNYMRAVQEASMTYGIPVAYGYLAARQGIQQASDKFRLVMLSFKDNIQSESVRAKLRAMAEASSMHGGLRGPLEKDEGICTLVSSLMSEAGISWPPENPTLQKGSGHIWEIIDSRVGS